MCVLCVVCMLFVRVSRGRDLYCNVVLNLEHCQCVSRRAGKGNKTTLKNRNGKWFKANIVIIPLGNNFTVQLFLRSFNCWKSLQYNDKKESLLFCFVLFFYKLHNAYRWFSVVGTLVSLARTFQLDGKSTNSVSASWIASSGSATTSFTGNFISFPSKGVIKKM